MCITLFSCAQERLRPLLLWELLQFWSVDKSSRYDSASKGNHKDTGEAFLYLLGMLVDLAKGLRCLTEHRSKAGHALLSEVMTEATTAAGEGDPILHLIAR